MVIDNDLPPLTDTEVHYLASEHVGDEFKIVIGHCGSSEGAARVVFMGDAWANFGTAVETIRLLQFEEDVPALLPPLLVAAVGCGGSRTRSDPLRVTFNRQKRR